MAQRRPSKLGGQVAGLGCAVLLSLLAMLVAFQARPGYTVSFGDGKDAYLLDGFHKPEVMDSEPFDSFRWTTADASVTLQDIGAQELEAVLRVNGLRPPGLPPPTLTVTGNHQRLLEVQPPPETTEYPFRVPRAAFTGGSLVLHLAANPFTPEGDVRELGLVAMSLRIEPASATGGFVTPPILPFLWVALAVLVTGLALALLGWAAGAVFVGSALPGLLAAWLIAADRLWLTSGEWYTVWPQVATAGALFALVVGLVGDRLLPRLDANWSSWQRRLLLTTMFAAFLVRLGGQLHPQINVVDLDFHAHRLELVESGQLLFEEYSAQSGGRDVFYLPGAYVAMLPLKWLLGDARLAVLLFTVGLSTLGALLLFYLAPKVLRDGRAGLLAAALYLILPLSIVQFSWGITANIFAEFFALLVFALLVGGYANLRPDRLALWLLVGVLFVALLTHTGGVQLLVVAYFAVLGLWAVRGTQQDRKRAAWAVTAFILASLAAYAVYYQHWTANLVQTLSDIGTRGSQTSGGGLRVLVSGSVDDPSLGLVPTYAHTRREWLLGGLRGFWQEAQAYFRVWPIAGALLGFLLVLQGWGRNAAPSDKVNDGRQVGRERNGESRLALAALGWAAAICLFAVVGLMLNLYVRYMLFALPLVSLGAGILLSHVWSRVRYGPFLAVLLLAFFTAEVLALWHYRITYLYK